jgi:hypothetical protein
MSFDILFHTARFTGKTVVKKNPFTGEVASVMSEEPLTATEVKAVRKVLKEVNAQGPDEHGCYVVELKDGGAAEVFSDQLKSGCMVCLRGITPDLCQFLFDVLKAGKWVMLPIMEDAVALTASPSSVKGVPDDFPRLLNCDSAQALAVLLTKGVKDWQNYRDKVMRGE